MPFAHEGNTAVRGILACCGPDPTSSLTIHRVVRCLLVIPALALVALAGDPGKDTDGDGLSDFSELHKYGTDPARADSDGDGIPDGDRDERREYTYSIRAVVCVLRPAAAVTDDYQDARVLEEDERHVTLEVVCYPLGTAAEAMQGDPAWRDADVREFVAPGLTANWDAGLQAQLRAGLAADGIDWAHLDDRALAAQASAWLMQHARYSNGQFTGYFTHFPDGRPEILPGLEDALASFAKSGLPVEEQWRRDLFAKSMFETRTHGSCTSSAIYLAGCLRALGLPTRILYAIPLADATDPAQLALVRKGITHHAVRKSIRAGVEGLGGWSAHTLNEVRVGGRWVRLNYSRLGQPPLDEQYMGLLLPVLRLHDWADARMAETVGRRQGLGERDALLAHGNPYALRELSDRFGAHARVPNDPVEEPPDPANLMDLTIGAAMWYADRPAGISMARLDQRSGHVLFQVEEVQEGGGIAQYKPFYEAADKDFVLRCEGHADVVAHAERGYWGSGLFYLRIPPEELARMEEGVAYALVPRNGVPGYAWNVREGVALTRTEELTSLTIDRIVWSDSPTLPERMRERLAGQLVLLAHVAEWKGFEKLKRFTARADPQFTLEAEGHATIPLRAGVGGITSADGATRYVVLQPAAGAEPERGVAYTLRPLNGNPAYRWRIGLTVTR